MLRSPFGSPWSACLLLVWSGIAALATTPADGQLIWPGSRVATIETEHLRVHVPIEHVESLTPLAARAETIYAHMIADAGYVPRDRLDVLFGDWVDSHNGYSFVTPFPVVQVELAPALGESTIFSGGEDVERTLVHEFAHHISNDRTHGFRKELEGVFGRVLPNDFLSLILFYLSTPAHQTMPAFWHEGLATWAETQYANPDSPWAGRGRDSLTHMVWRLDAADDAIPGVGDWRLTWHRWPYGRRVYTYGVAYFRYLQARFGDQFSLWELIREQSHMWPYLFNRGTKKVLGVQHRPLIAAARRSLELEQTTQLDKLREAPVTELERRTPRGMIVGAPAWISDQRVVFSTIDPFGKPRIHELFVGPSTLPNRTSRTSHSSYALSNLRSDSQGRLIYHEYNWRRFARAHVAGDVVGERLLQPDFVAGPDGVSGLLAAIRLPGGGQQHLVVHALDVERGDLGQAVRLATEGTPWSPAFRPGDHGAPQVVWVETTEGGSQLILGSVAGPGREVLYECRGRILHPVWSSDGRYVFFCSDQTGVANAYRLTAESKEVVPVTNVIGGVIACVPSPSGSTLAVVDHDRDGPYVATLPNDPEQWARSIPQISLEWPGEVLGYKIPTFPELHRRSQEGPLPHPSEIPAAPGQPPADLESEDYWGSRNIRPRFWMPTTAAAPYGGAGVIGFASDPFLTNVLIVGAGVGLVEAEPVGIASYTNRSDELEWGAEYSRAERTYYDEIVTAPPAPQEFDYTETIDTFEVRLGRGIVAPERRFRLFTAYGVSDYRAERSSRREYRGLALSNVPAFDGLESYAEVNAGYGDTTFFPTSYAAEEGLEFLATFRHSGLGADLDRNLAFLDADYVFSVWPELGQQVALGGQIGWSDGDRTLQGSYSIGGSFQTSIPRGYFGDTEAIGQHLLAYSIAYRAALWRPFDGYGTTPFRHRQVFTEVFFDAAKVSDDGPGDDGDWFRSVGAQLHTSWEAFGFLIQPGIGVAVQLDGDEDTRGYVVFGVDL